MEIGYTFEKLSALTLISYSLVCPTNTNPSMKIARQSLELQLVWFTFFFRIVPKELRCTS